MSERVEPEVPGFVESASSRPNVEEMFVFDGYRDYQREALLEASEALWEKDYDTVIMNLPTGVGKSPINTALARQAKSAFYTTPQKKLRHQLEDDDDLNPYYRTLRARADYTCNAGMDASDRDGTIDCESCPINSDPDQSCAEQGSACGYWDAKEDAMDHPIANLTFAALIYDGMIPPTVPDADGAGERQISFKDREVLVVDEAHNLAGQIASMWAGFVIGDHLPDSVYAEVPTGRLKRALNGGEDIWRFEQLEDMFHDVVRASRERVAELEQEIEELDRQISITQDSTDIQKREVKAKKLGDCQELIDKIERAWDDIDSGRPWVINLSWGEGYGSDPKVEVKPVDVDRILRERVWSRSEKRVLSSATIPYPNDPQRWADELGLGDEDFYYVNYPMPFDVENRPIDCSRSIDRFSSGGFEENIDEIAATIRELAEKHDGENGLVHTVSYDRAEKLYKRLDDIAVLHDRKARAAEGVPDSAFVDNWQLGDRQIFLTPANMEGIDLPGDKCRWQVLGKVPYPNLGDSRVRYIVRKRGDWDWYNAQTEMKIIQSVGRGVRKPGDSCTFYVLDECFDDIRSKGSLPGWFTDAIR